MTNFWQTLPSPFTILAPMENVTDVAFREVVVETASPDVFFTEFVSSDALSSPGRAAALEKLRFTENQRPMVAQIWGVTPEKMRAAAQTVQELGFDSVDINMGCPDKAVMKQGGGAALTRNFPLAGEIIKAVQEGAPNLPVSVKTRLGYNKNIADDWIPFLLSHNLQALTVHGRVAKQMSKGDANWNEIGRIVEMRNKLAPQTKIIGNGDVMSWQEVQEKHQQFNVDGVMIGRGIFADPWVFAKTEAPIRHHKNERIAMLLRHVELHLQYWGTSKNFLNLRKFFKMYVVGFPGANAMRQRLMECTNSDEVAQAILGSRK